MKKLTNLEEWRPIPRARRVAPWRQPSLILLWRLAAQNQPVKRVMAHQPWARRIRCRLGVGLPDEGVAAELAAPGES
jgi:hypothetical protein